VTTDAAISEQSKRAELDHVGVGGGREDLRLVKHRYMDPRTFRREDYEGDADTLIVEQAGRDLYLVKPLEG
jgi:hypothetical protein